MGTRRLLLLLAVLSAAAAGGTAKKVDTFTYVNDGEFGPYITEYDASYRMIWQLASLPFQMGFYNTTPNEFYIALRMGTTRSESIFRWVWEANRGRPVGENATFSLLPNGDLVLAEANGRVAWSTNTAGKGVLGLNILPNGNIALYAKNGSYIWQSFDHPTDTLLVGQSLAVGRALISRASAVDGSFRKYSAVLEPSGFALYVNTSKTSLRYGTLGSASSTAKSVTLYAEPTRDETTVEVGLSDDGGGSAILARLKYNATYSLLRLQTDGNLVVYTYYDPVDYRAWERSFALFDEQIGFQSGCWLPDKCGRFGLCEDEMCVGCPTRSGVVGWSKMCGLRETAAVCAGSAAAVGYYKVGGVESFLTAGTDGVSGVKVEECMRRCSGDCGCKGVLYWEKEAKCWTAPIIGTLANVANSSHVAYIKYNK